MSPPPPAPPSSRPPLNTAYFARCLQTLIEAHQRLGQHAATTIEYDIYRAACVKEFEIILEQSGKLLKKCIKPYLASSRQADQLTFKEVFRTAAHHGLLDLATTERWLQYRDNPNDTAHDYGEDFANETLARMPLFIADASALQQLIAAQAAKAE